jgi:hypothetical protein
VIYAEVNVARLAAFASGTEVTPEVLAHAGMIDPKLPVVILGHGSSRSLLKVRAPIASARPPGTRSWRRWSADSDRGVNGRRSANEAFSGGSC